MESARLNAAAHEPGLLHLGNSHLSDSLYLPQRAYRHCYRDNRNACTCEAARERGRQRLHWTHRLARFSSARSTPRPASSEHLLHQRATQPGL